MRYLCCGLLLVAACKTEHMNTPDAPGPPGPQWWSPKNGEVKDWDIQVKAPFDVSAAHTMYDLDLWSVVPSATTLDYGDGSPLTIPAGALPTAIATLHATTPPTIVICHVGVGAVWLTDPDYSKFPGHEASPPDNPTAPKAGSVIGWSYNPDDPYTTTQLRMLDITVASRSLLEPVLWKRFDLAKQIGCDGVEGYAIGDRTDTSSGFTTGPDDIYTMYGAEARQAHDRKLSAGMTNGGNIPSAIDMGATKLDWILIERCTENAGDCDLSRPFAQADKAIFALDYTKSSDGIDQTAATVCARQNMGGIAYGLYKDYPATKNVRTQCTP